MSLPIVVIVGRPNVGKSTLFNKMAGKGFAIVEDIPGVTRDRNYSEAEWDDQRFIVVDTGGFYADIELDIDKQVREQAFFAIDEADLIVHTLDGTVGITPADFELAAHVRESGKKYIFAVNKIDGIKKEPLVAEFYRLGDDPVFVSAATGYNFDEFMDSVVSILKELGPVAPSDTVDYPKVAVVGRPNVGKSTLVNSLLGKNRMIVSPIPGTTRDPIDSICTFYGRKYLFIDTAGIRRKARDYPVERFAMLRAMKSIERADVCLIVIDASVGIVAEDQKIAGLVHEYGKGAIFLINKWDLVLDKDLEYKRFMNEVGYKLFFLNHAPVITVSGHEKKRITNVFPVIDEVIEERKKRINTSDLNEFMKTLREPSYRDKRARLSFMNQVGIDPPRFILFSSKPEIIKDDYIRYIERMLREKYSFKGTPIKIIRKKK